MSDYLVFAKSSLRVLWTKKSAIHKRRINHPFESQTCEILSCITEISFRLGTERVISALMASIFRFFRLVWPLNHITWYIIILYIIWEKITLYSSLHSMFNSNLVICAWSFHIETANGHVFYMHETEPIRSLKWWTLNYRIGILAYCFNDLLAWHLLAGNHVIRAWKCSIRPKTQLTIALFSNFVPEQYRYVHNYTQLSGALC